MTKVYYSQQYCMNQQRSLCILPSASSEHYTSAICLSIV